MFRWLGLLLFAPVSLAAVAGDTPSFEVVKTRESGGTGVRLGDIPWTEAEKRLTADRVVVLPLGAGSKEHGPHLPLRTDAILAEYFARRVMEARPVVVLPTLTYGFYPAFLQYPGSTSLSFETQRDAVGEVCRSIARHGPRRFYVLNTGISTARPLKTTAEQLAGEGILMLFTDLTAAGKGAVDAVRQEKFGTHADEIETSMILYIEPGAVRMEKAVADGAEERPGPLTRNRENPLGHYAPSGVFGDATLATAKKGKTVVEGMLGDILKEIDALAATPAPRGTPRSPLDREGGASPP